MRARSLLHRALAAAVASVLLASLASCSSSDSGSSGASGSTAPGGSSASASTPPCSGPSGIDGAVPAGLGPGDLVKAVELTDANQSSPGFPTGSRIWRILYVSSGVDEQHLQLVCGLVAAPESGPKAFAGNGRMLSWAHGTVGVQAACLPASNPQDLFWAKMSGGIGAVGWAGTIRKRTGKPEDGALQTAMDRGWVVTATDYQPETYVLGALAAANVLDANRAGAQLLAQTYDDAPADYDFVAWGHSQGGHSALWASQLAEPYLAGTKPSKPTPGLRLVGVAAEAPASNFIVQPDLQPDIAPGNGLTDWEMHETIGVTDLPIPIPALQLQIGPALFSYIFGSWSKVSAGPQPAEDAAFPAIPANTPLDQRSLLTDTGIATVEEVVPLCLTSKNAKKVQKAVGKYRHAEKNPMLVPSVWNLPDDYDTGEFFHGGTDAACASATDGLANWCRWIRWNLPGPNGDNPYPKAALVDGKPVPVLIAQGADDTVIHCVPPKGAAASAVPPAPNCMSRALYDSLAAATYCPEGNAAGHLELALFHEDGMSSPASHFSIPGQIAAKGTNGSGLAFPGSRLDEFFDRAFTGDAEPGCTATVVNG